MAINGVRVCRPTVHNGLFARRARDPGARVNFHSRFRPRERENERSGVLQPRRANRPLMNCLLFESGRKIQLPRDRPLSPLGFLLQSTPLTFLREHYRRTRSPTACLSTSNHESLKQLSRIDGASFGFWSFTNAKARPCSYLFPCRPFIGNVGRRYFCDRPLPVPSARSTNRLQR